MLETSIKYLRGALLKAFVLCAVVGNLLQATVYVNKVVNKTSQPVLVQHAIPGHTEAVITTELTSLDSSAMLALLYKAILNDSADAIIRIVRSGSVNINAEINGKTPLTLAVLLKKPNAIKALLDYGAQVHKYLIEYAVKMNDLNSAILLIKKGGFDINGKYHLDYERTLLQFFISRQELQALKLLIKNNIDASTYFSSIGFDCSLSGMIYSKLPCSEDDVIEVLRGLIDKGLNVNDFMIYLLRWSANIDNEKLLNLLSKNGANPNYITKHEMPPLFLAISSRNSVACKWLINMGADVNMRSIHFSQSPLSFAIDHGLTDIVAILVEQGASL